MTCYWNDDFSGILTDKWTDISTGVGSAAIVSNALRLDNGAAGSAGAGIVESLATFTGDFDIEVKLHGITTPTATDWAARLEFIIDGTHYMNVGAYQSASVSWWYRSYNIGGGDNTNYVLRSGGVDGWVRLVRTGSSIQAYYIPGVTKIAWTALSTAQNVGSGDGVVRLRVSKTTTNPQAVWDFDDFLVNGGCPDYPYVLPVVVTNPVTDIDSDSALANGEVVSGDGITERGFVWSASANPTTSDNKVTVAGTTGVLSGIISGLSADSVYHVRCFATNGAGTAYGEDRSFQTLSVQYTEFEEMEERTFSKPIFIVTMGSFEVPQYDIIDLDQLTLSRSDDFSVVTSDITITLNNNTGKYTPSRSNFIWVGESWYHQYFKLEFTYQDINEKYLLFEGYITKWNQKNTKDPAYDSAVDGSFVEVTAEDHCSMLEERMIGVPNDDGSQNPFVHGHIFRQAETLGPDVFWTANESIGYETGDLSEVDSVTGTGTTIITVDPYDGTYCAQHQDNVASAFCKQDVAPTGTDEFHVSAMIKFTAIPEVPLFNTLWFMGIYTTGNLNSINININTDGTTHDLIGINMAGFGNVLSRISVSDYLDRWFKLDLITRNDLPNQQMVARLYLNGDDILTFVGSGSYPANNYRYAYWGLNFNSVVQSGWALCTDQIKCYTIAYPYGYYLPGGTYQEINGIYVDGAFWPRKNKAHWNPYWNNGRFQFSYISYTGKGTLPENYRTNLNYCLVDFLDFDKEPSGSIIIDATKDNINHPVDQIQAILEAVDLDSRIDSANFTMAKSINPDDTVGIYIDNQSAADGITSICQNTMNSFVERQGEFGILPFTGQHMIDYERSLVESKYHSIEQATDMDNIKTKVDVTWGWYDNDKHLFYRIKNEDMIAIVGNQEAKLDLSYGQDVSSNNADMAKIKAGLLLNRYSGPIDEVIIKGNLSFIRIEIGYGVLIHSDFYETELIYEVIEKVIDFNDKTVELRCHRYLGNGVGQAFMGSSTIAPTVLISGDSTFTGALATSGEETSIGSIRTNVDYAYLPYYSKARGSTVDPTFIYGNINYTPTQAESIGSSIDPTVAIS